MGVIDTPIGDSCFELIRDRIYTIIVDELEQQVAITYDESLMDATVYLERATPLNHAEFPAINIYYAGMVPLRETKNTAHRTYRYFIDFFGKAPTTDTERGDKRAAIKIERLMAVVDKILRDKRYITLGFEQPKIMSTRVQSMEVGKPIDSMQATDAVLARLEFEVDTPEDVVDIQPRSLPGFVTQVVFDDDNGYIFSGSNPPVSPDTINDIYVNNELIVKLDEGEDYNVQVVDETTGIPVGTWDAYLEQWLIPTPTTKSVTFAYPYTAAESSDFDYDIGWRQVNGYIPAAPTESQFVQQLDPDDPFKILYNDSAVTGITEHLFRFVGMNKGYMWFNPITTLFEFYLKDGTPSDKATVTGKDGGTGFVIDRLTGIAQAFDNQFESGGGLTGVDIMSLLWNSETYCGYTGGWWVPSYNELMGTMLPQTYGVLYYAEWRDATGFGYGSNLITSSRYIPGTSDAWGGIQVSTFGTISWAWTQTTATGRYYLPMRVFNEWPLT